MTRDDRDMERLLDQTLSGLRDATPDEAQMDAALGRVRARLLAAGDDARALESCEDHRALFDALDDGRLDEGRRWLVREHLRECAACADAHAARLARPVAAAAPPARRFGGGLRRLAAAAALMLPVAAGTWATQGWLPLGLGGEATIPAANGALYRVHDAVSEPAGEGLRPGERLRTAKDAGAELRLPDGSLVEVAGRSEVSWHRGWRNTTLRLHRGRVIVKAAPQGYGNLFVATDDCRVAVRGTVFSVTSAVKGSRVSVLEGEVHVHRGPETSVLLAGQQMTTDEAMSPVPLRDEIGWSRNIDEHLALMKELVALGRELERVPRPGLRYESRLAELLPATTIVYAAIPNLSDTVAGSYEVIRDKVATNDVLRRWWDENIAETGAESEIERAMQRVKELGTLLGDEIVVAIDQPVSGVEPSVLVLADVTDDDGLAAFLERIVSEQQEEHDAGDDAATGHDHGLAISRDATPRFDPATSRHAMLAWIHDGLLALSHDPARLAGLAAARAAGGGGFEATPLWAQLRERYRDGAGWLVAADIRTLLAEAAEHSRDDASMLERLGILDATLAVAERKRIGEQTINRATLLFEGPREGIAAWIAEPGPLGALDFVSARAHFAAGFVVADPAVLIRDMVERLDGEDGGVTSALAEFREQTGLDLIEDVAAPLGGEMAFALDGPLLPVPSWKLVVEVYDDVRLQRSMEALVREVNAELSEHGGVPLVLEQVTSAGRAAWILRRESGSPSVAYTFSGGYMIAAPQAAMLDLAIRTRASGYALTDAPKFRELLPADGPDDFSAFIWQDMVSLLGPLARQMGGVVSELSPEQRGLLEELAQESRASLTLAYGARDSITVLNAGSGPLGGDLGTLLGFGGLASVQQTMVDALRGTLESVESAPAS